MDPSSLTFPIGVVLCARWPSRSESKGGGDVLHPLSGDCILRAGQRPPSYPHRTSPRIHAPVDLFLKPGPRPFLNGFGIGTAFEPLRIMLASSLVCTCSKDSCKICEEHFRV